MPGWGVIAPNGFLGDPAVYAMHSVGICTYIQRTVKYYSIISMSDIFGSAPSQYAFAQSFAARALPQITPVEQ